MALIDFAAKAEQFEPNFPKKRDRKADTSSNEWS